MTKFNVKFSDNAYRAVAELAGWMGATMADVIRDALSLFWWLAKEYRQGNRLLIQRGETVTELLIPSLERLRADAAPGLEVVPTIDDPATAPRPSRGRRPPAATKNKVEPRTRRSSRWADDSTTSMDTTRTSATH
jgi:hypothetical protein